MSLSQYQVNSLRLIVQPEKRKICKSAGYKILHYQINIEQYLFNSSNYIPNLSQRKEKSE